MSVATPRVDIFTAEVIRNGLTSAAVEMAKTLRRTAHNVLLYDVQDYGVGVVSAEGELWGEAPGISVFLGCLPETIRNGLRKHGKDGFEPGDVLLVNDPYETGTHISDTSLYVPIFAGDDLLAFAVSTAHWADIGAKAPGGWCPDSTDVYQEGICFNHQKVITNGQPNRDLLELIDSNVRMPSTVRGDLDAQIACCRLGEARVQALVEKYGLDAVRGAMADTIERTDAEIRRRIGEIANGRYEASLTMDSDGVTPGLRPRVRVTVTVADGELRVGFEGSSRATRGPVNIPEIGSRAAARVALKALLMPLERANEGHFRAFRFDAPPGLIVSACRPSPCDSYGYVKGAIVELAFRALSQAMPERCPAGGLQLLAGFYSRSDPAGGKPFLFTDGVHGGNGASASADGPTLMRFDDGDSPNTPIEVIEMRFPLLCERFELRPGAAGAGRHRGGHGVVRDFRMLEEGVYLQTANECTLEPIGKGLAGGLDGKPSEIVVCPGTDKEEKLLERVTGFGPLAAGDIVSMRSAGGGGFGSPLKRQSQLVLDEVRQGLLAPELATSVYGVVLVPDPVEGWGLARDETEGERSK